VTEKSKDRKKLTKKQLDNIKSAFMEYKNPSEIARAFSVSRSTINWHINSNNWTALRKLSESEVFSSFNEGKKIDFVKMTQSAVTIMTRSLHHLATRADAPSMTEATRAADILRTLDNILRLDDGKPTDIIENTEKPMDDKELKKKLSADPFANIKKEEDEPKIN
jgi:predicted DNA-binding protein YlxM (UPF0122 family)